MCAAVCLLVLVSTLKSNWKRTEKEKNEKITHKFTLCTTNDEDEYYPHTHTSTRIYSIHSQHLRRTNVTKWCSLLIQAQRNFRCSGWFQSIFLVFGPLSAVSFRPPSNAMLLSSSSMLLFSSSAQANGMGYCMCVSVQCACSSILFQNMRAHTQSDTTHTLSPRNVLSSYYL